MIPPGTNPRGFPAIPHGWYAIAESSDLRPGELRTLQVFGGERVLFRTESGRTGLIDAHCAHLGAHLGRGGKVKGECVACPFHDWRYDATGRCVAINYARRIPPLAQVGAWQTAERDGLIHAAFPSGVTQKEVPHWPGLDDPDFRFVGSRSFTLQSHPQELAENTVDTAHFPMLHDSLPPEIELSIEGEVLKSGFYARPIFRGTPLPLPPTRIDITVYGLSLLVVRTRFPGMPEVAILQYATPTAEGEILVRHRFVARVGSGPKRVPRQLLASLLAAISTFEAGRDGPVLNHKVYRQRPVLCDGDGPIGRFRLWSRQFYVNEKSLDQKPTDDVRAELEQQPDAV